MKTSRSSNKQQSLFANTEQFLCKCGCGQYGFRKATGRKREFINDTHKKRAQRAKRKHELTDQPPTLTPANERLVSKMAGREYSSLWENFTDSERWVVHLATQHPQGYDGFWRAVLMLTKRQDSWWQYNVGGNEAVYDDNRE